MFLDVHPRAAGAAQGAARVLRRAADARGAGRARRAGRGRARCSATSCARWARDGWLGIGWPEEYGGQGRSVDSTSSSSSTRCSGPDAPFPFVTVNTVGPDDHGATAPRSRSSASSRASSPATSTSPSATPSPRPAPTSRRCAPVPCATATSGSSTATRSSPAAPTRPTTSGSPAAPTPTRPSTRASRSSSCRRRRPASRCTPIVTVGSVVDAPPRTTTTSACPKGNVVGEVNAGWRLITTSSTTSASASPRSAGSRTGSSTTSSSGAATDAGGDGVGQKMIDVPWVQTRPGRGARPARGDEAAQLADGGGGRRRHAHAGRRVGGEGVRHRDPRSTCTALLLGDPRRGRLPAGGLTRRGAARRGRARGARARRSTRSAVGSTRCCARSSPPPGSGMARQAR